MSALARLWREHRALLLAFVLALALMLFFALRTVVSTIYWSNPARRDLAIEGWMTPGYVARSWRIERDVVAEALGLVPGERRVSLAELAAERGVPLSEIEAALLEAIAAARAGQ